MIGLVCREVVVESSERPTPTIEDYLGVIYTLERDGEPVIGARLAEWLEVSPPTVTATLKRMVRDGWATLTSSKEVRLTAAGREAARSVLRRHMLAELLLARVLHVPWSQVHQEADAMEHTISPTTMQRIADKLGNPQTCPHGNPLPGHENHIAGLLPLAEARQGQRLVIRRVHEAAEERPELMAYLEQHGLLPGAEVVVAEVMPFNETLALEHRGQIVVLGLGPAGLIFAQEKPAAE
jgi:DtxR family transcriptional regulator, Mn-dependent transcriptional regulator